AYQGEKFVKEVQVTEDEYKKGRLDPKTADQYYRQWGTKDQVSGPDYPGAEVAKHEVSKAEYDAARTGKGNLRKYGEPEVEHVTYNEALRYLKNKEKNAKKYPGEVKLDRKGNSTITHYYVQVWFKPGTATKYLRAEFYKVVHEVKDVGRLGDVVGGQGFAWNQPTGKYVRTFGYPFAKHPDG